MRYAAERSTRLTLSRMNLNSFKQILDFPLDSEGLILHYLRELVQVKVLMVHYQKTINFVVTTEYFIKQGKMHILMNKKDHSLMK